MPAQLAQILPLQIQSSAQLGLDFKSLKIVEVHAAGMLPCLVVAVVSFVAALSRSFRDQLRDVFEFLRAAC